MSAASVLIKSDLASMLLILPEKGEVAWGSREGVDPSLSPGEQTRALRTRAEEAAQWIASQQSVRRRLRLAVLDVDDALCIWLKPASLAGPVLGAAFRSACEDWGEEGAAYTPEPLIQPASPKQSRLVGRAKNAESVEEEPIRPSSCGVVGVRDPLIRIWLDALDQRGLHPESVMTLWHAISHAWRGEGDQVRATVLSLDGHRLVWAWHRGADLLAAGSASGGESGADESEATASRAASRISLDWLTWAAQIGVVPERIRIIGAESQTIGASIARTWGGDSAWTGEPNDDPVGSTIRAAALSSTVDVPRDGRRRLSRLESRPTRTTRRQYQIVGAALTLGAIACISLGGRLLDERTSMTQEWISQRSTLTERVKETWPGGNIAPGESPVDRAQSLFQQELNREAFTPPPAPRPLLAEAHRITSALLDPFDDTDGASVSDADDQAMTDGAAPAPPTALVVLQLVTDQQSSFQVRVQDRREVNLLTQRLSAPFFAIDWRTGGRTSATPLEPEFVGTWKERIFP